MIRRAAFAIAALTALSAPALAGAFKPPEGCETWLTVQSRACRVSNYYKCSADAPGDQWRADFDQQGVFFISRIDFETQWVESFDLDPTVRQVLDPSPEDAANFSGLLATGTDTFSFGLSDDTGVRTHVTGYDRLTGEEAVIDGVTLKQTEYQYTETDAAGTILRQARGNEYIHPEWRLFFSGAGEWNFGDGYVPFDGTPRDFIFPGEPGFQSTEPLYDCDAVLSKAAPAGPLERLIHVAD